MDKRKLSKGSGNQLQKLEPGESLKDKTPGISNLAKTLIFISRFYGNDILKLGGNAGGFLFYAFEEFRELLENVDETTRDEIVSHAGNWIYHRGEVTPWIDESWFLKPLKQMNEMSRGIFLSSVPPYTMRYMALILEKNGLRMSEIQYAGMKISSVITHWVMKFLPPLSDFSSRRFIPREMMENPLDFIQSKPFIPQGIAFENFSVASKLMTELEKRFLYALKKLSYRKLEKEEIVSKTLSAIAGAISCNPPEALNLALKLPVEIGSPFLDGSRVFSLIAEDEFLTKIFESFEDYLKF